MPKKGIRREELIDIIDEDATEDRDTHAEQQRRNRRKAEKARADETEDEDDDTTLGFAVFALRDLKEGEEAVLLGVGRRACDPPTTRAVENTGYVPVSLVSLFYPGCWLTNVQSPTCAPCQT